MTRFARLLSAAGLSLAMTLQPLELLAATSSAPSEPVSADLQIVRGGGGRGGGGGSRGGGSRSSSGRTGFSSYSGGGGGGYRGSQRPSGGWSSGSSGTRRTSTSTRQTPAARTGSGQAQRQSNAGARQSSRSTAQGDRRDAAGTRQEGRQEGAGNRQDNRTDRTDTRQDSRSDRTDTRQDSRSDRVSDRTDLRGDRADNRWDNAWSGWARPGWGSARPWNTGWYGGSGGWGWWNARPVGWGVAALATGAVITAAVDEAIEAEVTTITVPDTSYELYYPSVAPEGPYGVSFAVNTGTAAVEMTADCQAGLLDGRVPQTAEEAQLLNAACSVAYGE
jgi:hypothetical protein